MADHVHENWWLIEATFAPGLLYYAGHRRDGKAPHMIADANRAVHFPDQDSALYTICHLLGIPVGGGFALEHMGYWVAEHIFDYTPAGGALSPGVSDEAEIGQLTERAYAYDKIDRYLRNNLDDSAYAGFLAALDLVWGSCS